MMIQSMECTHIERDSLFVFPLPYLYTIVHILWEKSCVEVVLAGLFLNRARVARSTFVVVGAEDLRWWMLRLLILMCWELSVKVDNVGNHVLERGVSGRGDLVVRGRRSRRRFDVFEVAKGLSFKEQEISPASHLRSTWELLLVLISLCAKGFVVQSAEGLMRRHRTSGRWRKRLNGVR
jgi:hypothetical protein